MSTTSLQPPVALRRRTNPLDAAYSMSKASGSRSRLPSPPEDELGASSDDTVTAAGRQHSSGSGHGMSNIKGQFTAGSGIVGSDRDHVSTGHHSPPPSISSRLAQPPSTPQSQSSAYFHTRTRSPSNADSDSDSDNSDHGLTDAAHSIASSTSWADLPLLITLVPPVVALFTGGDYLRDALLTCLLVWYLYQLIKVPWDIYLASLPLHHSSQERSSSQAHSELRTTRLAALLLCVVTPFLGATLLRLGASLLYPNSLSWLSTSLFVLAAGIRPWRHLTHLVLTRTEALHLAAHRPSQLRAALLAPRLEAKVQHREREREFQRVEALETEMAQLRAEVSVLTERARGMAKHLRTVERELSTRTGTVQARVEVLERYGPGPTGSSGVDLVRRGVGKIIRGVVCTVFPFMEQWFDEQAEVGLDKGKGKAPGTPGRARGKKAKRLRGAVNNLPSVPELDEVNGTGAFTDWGKGAPGVHLAPRHEQPSGVGTRLVDLMTWPLRVMRGIVVGWFGIMRG